jgi:carbonic anhydrase/acetyltransferase-like protein (isoleucine patch superfamily)
MGSILLDNSHVEPWCIIGAGALVPSGMRVPRGSLVLGSPGRVVRTLKERDIESIRHGCAVYVEMAERARKNI